MGGAAGPLWGGWGKFGWLIDGPSGQKWGAVRVRDPGRGWAQGQLWARQEAPGGPVGRSEEGGVEVPAGRWAGSVIRGPKSPDRGADMASLMLSPKAKECLLNQPTVGGGGPRWAEMPMALRPGPRRGRARGG